MKTIVFLFFFFSNFTKKREEIKICKNLNILYIMLHLNITLFYHIVCFNNLWQLFIEQISIQKLNQMGYFNTKQTSVSVTDYGNDID